MRLVIDVSKDIRRIEFDGNVIELDNVPEDRQWVIDELRDTATQLRKELEDLKAGPPFSGVSAATATEVLREILGGHISAANKINCIKFVRQITLLGLKESKDIVDALIPPTPRTW